MPEIAEAHTMANVLYKTLVVNTGKIEDRLSITNIEGRRQEDLLIPTPLRIDNVYAYGKKVIISTDKGLLVFSLGLNGNFLYTKSSRWRNTFQIGYYQKIGDVYLVDEKLELYFHADHTGRLDFLPTLVEQYSYFKNIGPDLLLYPPDSASFLSRLRSYSQKQELCVALLDQNLYSGIGNYLKSEILYLADLHPSRTLSSLTNSNIEILRLSILDRVNQAYKTRGHFIKDYVLPDGNTGEYVPIIYGRNIDCKGNIVVKQKFKDGRWSYYVPSIQKILTQNPMTYSV